MRQEVPEEGTHQGVQKDFRPSTSWHLTCFPGAPRWPSAPAEGPICPHSLKAQLLAQLYELITRQTPAAQISVEGLNSSRPHEGDLKNTM